MNVVSFSDFALNYGKTFLSANVSHNGLQLLFDLGRENLSSVFDAPYDVIIDVIHARSCVCIIIVSHTYSITHIVTNVNSYRENN